MKIELMDYNGTKTKFDIGENVRVIHIYIISGDEVAYVIYEDYSHKVFDTGFIPGNQERMIDNYDGDYELYNLITGNHSLNYKKWLNRTSSYSYMP